MNRSATRRRPVRFAIALSVIFMLATCDSFLIEDVFRPVTGVYLEVVPNTLVLPLSEQFRFGTEGGSPPCSVRIVSGGGSIDTEPASSRHRRTRRR